MEVDLVTDEASEDENYGVDDNTEDYLNFESERCGICTDFVIDRGVLDCCQHWFCFACIDNWATITSLCPLCQNEFQLITCVPVYDTVGGNQTDDDTNLRDDDWFIEGKNNTLSFPSYYIDENAVVCLDGDGCKIRSGSVAIEEDSDIDTSIACDFCDKWYHAFCVGFDPESTCDSSWLCPRCSIGKAPQKPDRLSVLRNSYHDGLEIAAGNFLEEASFSGRVSVSVADDGETAVVVSLIEGNERNQESVLGCSKDMENTLLCSSLSNTPNSDALPGDINSVEPNSGQQEIELSLSRDNSYAPSHSISPSQLKINADDAAKRASIPVKNRLLDSGLDLDLGLSMSFDSPETKDNDIAEDHGPDYVAPTIRLEECILPADSIMPNKMEVLSPKSMISDEKEIVIRSTGTKRKHKDSRTAVGETKAHIEGKSSHKKIKAEPICLMDQTAVSVLDDSSKVSTQSNSRSINKSLSKKENGTSDIMDIVQGTDRRSLKQSDATTKERETATGLRLKKIMRRPGDDKDSSVLVQELRKKIKEEVRNKSSEEPKQNLFDPKLLDAFRAALAGSGAENRKPTLDVRAKKSLLQKGKIRESLTKKIYGAGGKRRRAWTRECEVEFWKHRCIKASKPEKIQALKSVLDILRDNSDSTKEIPRNEEEAKGSILSRLYLADNSVFPRKNDVKPVLDLKAVATSEQKRESGLTEKASTSLLGDQSDRNPQRNNNMSPVIVPPLDGKETKKIAKSTKTPPEKEMASKSENIKSDRRKWALELLARRTAASGNNVQEKEEDSNILKGNFTLLAQLPKDMRPVLAPSRYNKIPTSVRQAQLYRLAEHFLKKANLSVICRAAETELAVADAVNIEKEVADRSNSKLVYVNLCSQELLRRSYDLKSDKAKEANPSSTTESVSDGESEEANTNSLDLEVDEALKKAGLMSDSPPSSPDHPTEEINNKGEPDNVFEVDSHPEIDIYGDFEYNLEDDDFIGASAVNISKLQPEESKIKMVFSSLQPEKPNRLVEAEALDGLSGPLESRDKTIGGESTVDRGIEESLVQNSSVDNDEEPSVDECEELYGPDKEPLIVKYPEIVSITRCDQAVNHESHGENGEKGSEQPSEGHVQNLDGSKQSPSDSKKGENPIKKEKTTKSDAKQSEHNSNVMKKVEAYIKEHVRPLCKSGVITVEQYRWAVGKTTEKIMKYHSKEKNANFLIKEGEKVKKLAEQYVEAAQQKAKS
ncbi:hypothetical protein BUALT_Bualt05G0043500 [Buddleja alternifolia]|uniref:Uncharacterized protein n=1 Tax=Buddleja alternifolia TaxID=168488 RepID=A0AAV6XSD9_9LAMI|nr:hypothetical protein BUALT_Bualt05G0043500 [Buddleja alternifolia]